MSTRPADYAVVGTAVAMAMVILGMTIGEARVRDQIATTCQPQPGSMLASAVQSRDGVTCNYVANIVGRAPRKAVRL